MPTKHDDRYLQNLLTDARRRLQSPSARISPQQKRTTANTLERSIPSSEQEAMTEQTFETLLFIEQLRNESK